MRLSLGTSDAAIFSASASTAAEPEALSFTPGPSATPSRCAPMTTVSSGSPAMESAMTLKVCVVRNCFSITAVPSTGASAGAASISAARVSPLDCGRVAAGESSVARTRGDVGQLVVGRGFFLGRPLVVVDEDGPGVSGGGVVDLLLERADAALHEHDRPGRDVGEVGRLAPEAAAVCGEGKGEGARVRGVDALAVVEVRALVGGAVDGERGFAELGGVDLEHLPRDREGAGVFEHLSRRTARRPRSRGRSRRGSRRRRTTR